MLSTGIFVEGETRDEMEGSKSPMIVDLPDYWSAAGP